MTIVKVYLYAGIILIWLFAALHYFLYLSLREEGRNYIASNWFWPVLSDYLKLRSKHGWPSWPAYLVVPTLVLGLVLFLIGVDKLSHI
jgi:hypothetical protein